MRALGLLGLLLAAAIVLILLVKTGQSVAGVEDGGGSAKTGSQKAYEQMKGDDDMDDPKDVMRGALKGDL